MICDGYFGELQKDWKNAKSPYEILANKIQMLCGTSILLSKGDSYFGEKVQIDWGSFVWKCTQAEFKEFMLHEEIKFEVNPIFESGKEYGLVYIDTGVSGEDFYGG